MSVIAGKLPRRAWQIAPRTRNYALVVQDGDRETSLSEILELQAWLSRKYMPLLAQYVEQIKSGASDDALAEHGGSICRRLRRSTSALASDVALAASAVDADCIGFQGARRYLC